MKHVRLARGILFCRNTLVFQFMLFLATEMNKMGPAADEKAI